MNYYVVFVTSCVWLWFTLSLKVKEPKYPSASSVSSRRRGCEHPRASVLWQAPELWGQRGAPARGRCLDPNTNPDRLLPTGHHRERLCPHCGRAAAEDRTVPAGGGQGREAPRRPEANHSPLRTGMYPGPWTGLVFVLFCFVLAEAGALQETGFSFPLSLAKPLHGALHIFECLFGTNMVRRGIFQKFWGNSMALVINELNSWMKSLNAAATSPTPRPSMEGASVS